jgi:hypothetical protein
VWDEHRKDQKITVTYPLILDAVSLILYYIVFTNVRAASSLECVEEGLTHDLPGIGLGTCETINIRHYFLRECIISSEVGRQIFVLDVNPALLFAILIDLFNFDEILEVKLN